MVADTWMALDLNAHIKECRTRFGASPRMTWADRRHLRPPRWMRNSPDALEVLYRMLERLWSEGVVVWGQIVQVNSNLFEPGSSDLPGELIFCSSPEREVDLERLGQAAEELMAFKGTKPHDEALRRLADHLTLEYTRAFGMKLPETFGVGPGVVLSSTVFVRH
ncbi:MAG: hypothetical protein AAFX99_17855, partial [Myxococcota bacterium]